MDPFNAPDGRVRATAPAGQALRRLAMALVAVLALLGLAALLVLADGAWGGHRLLHAALGLEGVERACRAPLADALRRQGFEPDDIDFGETPALTASSATGRVLTSPFTFADGAARIRVDGIVACAVDGTAVRVEMRTSASPVRAG